MIGVADAIIPLTTPDTLEIRILDSDMPASDIDRAVQAHNEAWGDFFQINELQMRSRFGCGELFLGLYKNEALVGFLETMSHNVDIPKNIFDKNPGLETALKIAKYASDKLS